MKSEENKVVKNTEQQNAPSLKEILKAEEAELNANHFENFNFEPVGVESALLLDRAMSEGERYFNFKRGLTERINSKETEMFNYQKKFDEVTKEYERKSQAVRENMASINEQLNATSVKIEANYLKKRYNEEQQKQQQLEKDYEYAQINFTKQQQEMEQSICIWMGWFCWRKSRMARYRNNSKQGD